MQKINYIIKFLISFFMFFLLSFVWIRFLLRSIILTITFSTIISLFVEFLLQLIIFKKEKKTSLKQKEKEEAENMFLSLSISQDVMSFYYKLASTRYKCDKKKNYVVIQHDDYNVILYPFIIFSTVSPEEIRKIIVNLKNENFKKLVVCCHDFSKEALSFSKNFNFEIVLMNKFETYLNLYKEYNVFPTTTLNYKKTKKESLKDILSFSFNRSKTKNYLFSAVVILFSSFFIRLNLYYSIFASLLIIFAIVSFFHPTKKGCINYEL